MILCDTSIIVAALRPSEMYHVEALEALSHIRMAAITTWPCITEAMHILGHTAGGQEKLRRQIELGVYGLLTPNQEDAARACALMRKYEDTPMDFADASLVVAAENLNIRQILTLDSHFHVFRIHDKTSFEVIP